MMDKATQKELRKTFSKNLVFWLKKRSKTQSDLYKKNHVSSATASDWCNAKKMPRIYNIIEIAEWLNIDISDLFNAQ